MEYPKPVMSIKELKKMGMAEEWLTGFYKTEYNRRNKVAWKIGAASNSKMLFDTEGLEKYRKSQCGI
jgi:hypothetical protein